MKLVIATLVCLIGTALAGAADRIPLEEAQRHARLLCEHSAKVDDLPHKIDVDMDKPSGLRQGDHAALAIPGKTFSEETFAKAGKDVTPIGHLWMRKLAPAKDRKVTPNDKLRYVTVTANGQDHNLLFFLVGIRKTDKDGLELVLIGKEKEPVATLPLTKAEAGAEQPIDVEGKKNDDDTGLIIINLLGKYQAKLVVMEPEA